MPYTGTERRKYAGSITNTDRWQQYQHKPGDVFVCTPPKCGTTWTIAIVTMLTTGRTDVAPQELAQWVDAEVVPINDVVDALTSQRHRRCIKTHTPFDGIPWYPDTAYIAVYRHPIDVLLSLRKHLINAYDTRLGHPYIGSEEDAVINYVSLASDPDDFDFDCLTSLVHHYQSYAATPRPDNPLLLHYADMLADARGAIERIADHIGIDGSPELVDAILEASSFGQMKSKAASFAPFSNQGYWRDPQAFFDSAGTRKWVGKLSEATVSL
ncbi:MAG: sulfotransferase domain-containing protein [Hyphomicrobiales bacterium]|nr:sulfotransferase domain-containing protein [Hyphomicrobiales bacterium]